MIRWIATPLFCVALFFCASQSSASDVNFRVGVGTGGYYHPYGYSYYPYNDYTTYYPYTYDDYGYYTPSYSWSTTSPWYDGWYGNVYLDNNYWRGYGWDGGRGGSWNGSGSFKIRSGGFSGRASHRR